MARIVCAIALLGLAGAASGCAVGDPVDAGDASGREGPRLEGSGGAPPWSPAPRPPPMTVASLGGPTMTAPRLVPVLFDGDDPASVTQIQDFLAQLPASSYYAGAAAAYDTGPLTIAPPVSGGAAPSALDDVAVQTWIAAGVASGALPPRDDATLYVLFYPEATTVTFWGMTSCAQFGGYHMSTTLEDGSTAIYAVIPRCPGGEGVSPLDELTVATTHELFEAATDPELYDPAYAQPDPEHLYWQDVLGGEVGDLCDLSPDGYARFPDLPFLVQRIYSNASALAGHDPCVPAPDDRPYFAATPAPPGGATGVDAPVGGSASVELDLWSDGPIDAWQVVPIDSHALLGEPAHLAFALDRDTGTNGDKLELTITVLDAATPGEETYVVYAIADGHANPQVGMVWVE